MPLAVWRVAPTAWNLNAPQENVCVGTDLEGVSGVYPFAGTRAKLYRGAKQAMKLASQCRPYGLNPPISARKESPVLEPLSAPTRVTQAGTITNLLHRLDF